MFYCLNLSSLFDSFRLEKDENWRSFRGPKLVENTDFTTENITEILTLLKPNATIELEGKVYRIEPEVRSSFNIDSLSYSFSCHHYNFPGFLSREQFDAVLASGDDKQRNRLVLRTNGKFDIFTGRDTFLGKRDHRLVSFLSGFGPLGGYVGPKAVSSEYNLSNQRTFDEFVASWIYHLKTGNLGTYIDDYTNTRDSNSLQVELQEIEDNWATLRQRWIP